MNKESQADQPEGRVAQGSLPEQERETDHHKREHVQHGAVIKWFEVIEERFKIHFGQTGMRQICFVLVQPDLVVADFFIELTYITTGIRHEYFRPGLCGFVFFILGEAGFDQIAGPGIGISLPLIVVLLFATRWNGAGRIAAFQYPMSADRFNQVIAGRLSADFRRLE